MAHLRSSAFEDTWVLTAGIEGNMVSSEITENLLSVLDQNNRPNPLVHFFKKKHKRNKKVAAMILAFPFPFGLVGLHRIYLGCAPYVPVVYIATLGGVFGILPLVDFIVLATSKNLDGFINNPNVFMWVK